MSQRSYPEPRFDDAIDAREQQRIDEAARREAARLKVREAFPKCVEFADLCREHFGDQVEMLWAFEDGYYIGKPSQEVIEDYEQRHGPVRKLRL